MHVKLKFLLALCFLFAISFGGIALPELIRLFVSLTLKSAAYMQLEGI